MRRDRCSVVLYSHTLPFARGGDGSTHSLCRRDNPKFNCE